MGSDDGDIHCSDYDVGDADDDVDVKLRLRGKCMEKVGVDGNGGQTGLLFSKKTGKGGRVRSILLL